MSADPFDDSGYQAAVSALFARQPNRTEPGLERIHALAELLDHPERAYPSIQITGTNGKTTTARMVTSLLGALGLSAGTYTSPHLQDVRERFRINGELIGRLTLAERLGELAPFLAVVDERFPERVSFFEALTALAFVHFADAPVDVAVFEVGLGGTWDATNIVRGEVAVLTRVSLDHTDLLGSSIAQIATEKAGIIKHGSVVISDAQEAEGATAIARAAADAEAQLVVAGRDFGLLDRRAGVGGQQLDLRGVTGNFEEVFVPLHGAHQAANAACALAAVEGFFGFAGGLDPDLVRQGFAAVTSPGRLEVLRTPYDERAAVVLDGAHNADGARALSAALRAEFVFRHHVLVLGVLGDKDVEALVEGLVPAADHVVVTEPATARALPAEALAKVVSAAGLSHEIAPDVVEALERAKGVAAASDAVVVTGSLYTVGQARDALGLPAA